MRTQTEYLLSYISALDFFHRTVTKVTAAFKAIDHNAFINNATDKGIYHEKEICSFAGRPLPRCRRQSRLCFIGLVGRGQFLLGQGL